MKRRNPAAMAAMMLGCAFLASASPSAAAQTTVFAASAATTAGSAATTAGSAATTAAAAGEGGSSLEAAASKAGDMGRKVAMSLIGLGLAVAAITLAFRRNFKEATGVIVIGLLAVLLASPTGESLLQNTVGTLFGS
jgi:hypothetical protein